MRDSKKRRTGKEKSRDAEKPRSGELHLSLTHSGSIQECSDAMKRLLGHDLLGHDILRQPGPPGLQALFEHLRSTLRTHICEHLEYTLHSHLGKLVRLTAKTEIRFEEDGTYCIIYTAADNTAQYCMEELLGGGHVYLCDSQRRAAVQSLIEQLIEYGCTVEKLAAGATSASEPERRLEAIINAIEERIQKSDALLIYVEDASVQESTGSRLELIGFIRELVKLMRHHGRTLMLTVPEGKITEDTGEAGLRHLDQVLHVNTAKRCKQDILRFVRDMNEQDRQVPHILISKRFGLSRPRARKYLRVLKKEEKLREERQGRCNLLYVTEEGERACEG